MSTYSGIDISLLPPCKSSLDIHVTDANYQTYVWLSAHERHPDQPKIEDSGWRYDKKEELKLDWAKDHIMPLDLIEILSRTSNNDKEAYENDEAEIRQQIPIVPQILTWLELCYFCLFAYEHIYGQVSIL